MTKYRAILADPPWKFKYRGKSVGSGRRAENHYPVMDIKTIRALPVADLSDDDCCLFLWVIDSMLPQGLEVMKEWGFKYKTVAFTWAKTNRGFGFFKGMGFWTRCNPEQCLLGTKGKPKRRDANVEQLILSPRREHSRKPDAVYSRIEKLVDGPYIELFARRKREGWDAWGNEVQNDVELKGESDVGKTGHP